MATTSPTRESYKELETAYDFYNTHLFGGELPAVLFTYQRNRRTYGFFTPERFGTKDGEHSHELAMNPVYFALQPAETILANLVHNMVHVWQYQNGKPGTQGYHNREFADRMKAAGLHPSDTSAAGGKETGEKMGHYIVPGGPFIVATRELLASAWALTWFDRFPPMDARPGAQAPGSAGPGTDGPPVDLDDEAEPVSPSMVDEVEGLAGDLVVPMQENRSNRHKYSCPECAANVWGKPGLHVLCGDCGLRLAEEGAELVPAVELAEEETEPA